MKAPPRQRGLGRTGGFTLIEVLVVILIVGILTSLALPLIGNYAARARDARVMANFRQLELAASRYALEHKGPVGFVYDPNAAEVYVPYRQDGAVGVAAQLELPTDSNGNVMGDAIGSAVGPFSYGPYLHEAFVLVPSSFLLAVPPESLSLTNPAQAGKRPTIEGGGSVAAITVHDFGDEVVMEATLHQQGSQWSARASQLSHRDGQIQSPERSYFETLDAIVDQFESARGQHVVSREDVEPNMPGKWGVAFAFASKPEVPPNTVAMLFKLVEQGFPQGPERKSGCCPECRNPRCNNKYPW